MSTDPQALFDREDDHSRLCLVAGLAEEWEAARQKAKDMAGNPNLRKQLRSAHEVADGLWYRLLDALRLIRRRAAGSEPPANGTDACPPPAPSADAPTESNRADLGADDMAKILHDCDEAAGEVKVWKRRGRPPKAKGEVVGPVPVDNTLPVTVLPGVEYTVDVVGHALIVTVDDEYGVFEARPRDKHFGNWQEGNLADPDPTAEVTGAAVSKALGCEVFVAGHAWAADGSVRFAFGRETRGAAKEVLA